MNITNIGGACFVGLYVRVYYHNSIPNLIFHYSIVMLMFPFEILLRLLLTKSETQKLDQLFAAELPQTVNLPGRNWNAMNLVVQRQMLCKMK